MKTRVISVGPEVKDLLSVGCLIMFNNTAPAELKEVAAIHEKESDEENVLHVGGKLRISGKEYTLDFVGDDANDNFDELGHLAVYFNNEDEVIDKLPGAIFVSSEDKVNITKINEGDIIEFI
ncbi:PTS glucitol/sorbitol transporter subunit IIA [Ligilactobacillus salivarius]|uniref:PTS glucitol/sorbitol transporter subunit IIA n=1 Tax=Ligilactobacillus salivarius TaxID=1624 RepID=UPI0030FAE752